VIRAAAQEPSVQRIFVNAAIKKRCAVKPRATAAWLHKVRPMYGHDYHFHIRHQMSAWRRRMREPARTIGGDGCSAAIWPIGSRIRLSHPKPRKEPQAKPDDPGAIACRLPPGAGRSGREAVERGWPGMALYLVDEAEWLYCCNCASPPLNFNVYERRLENADMHLRIATMAVLLADFSFCRINGSAGAADDQGPQETSGRRNRGSFDARGASMDSASLARLIETWGLQTRQPDDHPAWKYLAEAYYAPYSPASARFEIGDQKRCRPR